ncbi:MAG: hypothetical protein ACFCUT_06720 [Kiloniellaceae bacterium]
MTDSSRERVRRHRARKNKGVVWATVEVDVALKKWLVSGGWLSKAEQDDPKRVGSAVVYALWCHFLKPERR